MQIALYIFVCKTKNIWQTNILEKKHPTLLNKLDTVFAGFHKK
jgi:hypothetical protein